MYYRCCVPNCESIRQNVKLHQIPVGSVGESRKLWVKAIVAVSPNCTDQIYTEKLHNLFICHKHFERRFITGKNRVLINGYPSLFTEEEIASGVPSKVDPEVAARDSARAVARDHACTRRFHVDHTYVKINDGDQWMEQLIASGIPGKICLFSSLTSLSRADAPPKRRVRCVCSFEATGAYTLCLCVLYETGPIIFDKRLVIMAYRSYRYKKCTVCNTRRVPGSDVFLAALPLDPARCRLWVQAIGQEDLVHLPIEKLHTLQYVCAIHFAREDFNIQGNRLLPSAVPMRNLPLPPLPESVFADFPLHVGWDKEKHRSGKISNDVQLSDARHSRRLQGPHEDHTYDVTDRTITLPIGTQKIEKRIDVNPDAKHIQIEVPPVIEPVPRVEETFDPDYEIEISPSPLPDVEDSGGETVFSWQRQEELIEADDPEEPSAPADPTLALFCESDPDPDDPDSDADLGLIFDPQPDQAVPSVPAPVDNRCKDCKEVNAGFEFWCVQCTGGALCGACAGRAPHHAHYVLRAPMGCSRARTHAVLAMIRQQLQNQNLSQHGTVDDDLKLEVKEEPPEVPPASSSDAEPDPLACEPVSLDDLEPEFPHEFIEPPEPVSLRSPMSLHAPRSSSRSPHSPPHSPNSLPSWPASPPSPLSPCAPASPTVTPEPDTHKANKSIAEIAEHRESLQPPRLRKPTDAHKEILLIPTQRKLVKLSPAELKRAFLPHRERVVTTQNKQLKVYQPHEKLTPQVLENIFTTRHKGPTYEGNSRTTRLQVRGSQKPVKVTSEPQPSETVTIDLDAADETVEYLEEGLESDTETVDNVDNHEDDVLDEADLEDDLSDEVRIVRNVPERGVKRKKIAEETSPVKGPAESMVRALPSKAVIQVRPLSSLEIRNWAADRKRLRKD